MAGSRFRYDRGTGEFDRVVFFSDAVFAIAMTLLVVGIGVPKVPGNELGDALRDLSSEILSFFISFVVIAFYWRGHHRFVSRLGAFDDVLLLLNLAFLAVVAFVPFPTALVGAYEEEPVAFVLYAVTLCAVSVIGVLMHGWSQHRELLRRRSTPMGRRHLAVAGLIPIAVFLLSIPLALATSTSVALYSWLVMWPLEMLVDRVWPDDELVLDSVEA